MEMTEREREVRARLDALYGEQAVFGRGLGNYKEIAELDAELLEFIRARKASK